MIDRIAKLLALAADNANVHEAAAALEAAHKIMREHQISEAEVREHIERDDMTTRAGDGFIVSVWECQLASFVQGYIGTVFCVSVRMPGKRRKALEWYGRSADTEWAATLYTTLHRKIKECAGRAGWSTATHDGRAFALGFVRGLWDATRRVDPEHAAIVRAAQDAKDYATRTQGMEIPPMRPQRAGPVALSPWCAGVRQGRAQPLAVAALAPDNRTRMLPAPTAT